ncbi:hypothetical protein ABW21_db0205039 [Orbilia brochopaga]|nr:hypothetical protein ABW21_db0205039 [Drechslerella brochopaga]
MSTCPEVPSFSGIRVHPSAPKRAVPLRRPMPKARQASASASAGTPTTTKTAATASKDPSKQKLSLSSPIELPHRDDGPEEGEISDEDDHYSPAEATTPIHAPFVNPFEMAAASKSVPPKPPFLNIETKLKSDLPRKDQSGLNMSQTQDLQSMGILELRKSAQAAVMYLACSAKMSFDDIVSEGIDRRVVASYFSRLKLPMPTSEPRELPSKEQPKPIGIEAAPKDTTMDPKSAISEPVQSTPINNVPVNISSTLGQPPSSLPPRPPPPALPPKPHIIPKVESVVSRFNQSLPGLNFLQQASSPASTPPPTQAEAIPQDTTSTPSQTNSIVTLGFRNRKRPVAADFDTEIKPASSTLKQARFGNRELLETSNLVFDVSDNEDGDHEGSLLKQVSRVTSQTSGVPSRPDSTTPEDSEKINESIRAKEAEIELMRQKIKLMSRKRKIAGVGDSGSGPPTKPSTPLPMEPSVDLGSEKQTKLEQVQKLEQVEQFLHRTLDQIEAGNAQSVATIAVPALSNEMSQVESESSGVQSDTTTDSIMAISQNGTQDGDTTGESLDVNGTSTAILSNSQVTESEKVPSSEQSYEMAPVESEAAHSEEADDGQGEPMDLSDLSSASEDSDLDLGEATAPIDSKGSNSDNSLDDTSSEDFVEDIEMLDGAVTDSVSSPMQEEPENDNYDPESRELDIGEVSLPSGNAKLSQIQPPSVIEMAINATTSAKQDRKKEEYGPYQSALASFKSFRYHPSYSSYVSQGFKSLTYSNHIDSELPICDFETRGGTCNDPQCRWQHFRQMVLPESQILSELAEPDANLSDEDKEAYKSTLAQNISEQGDALAGDFEKLASNIVEYRRQQLGDPTRVLRNL